MGYCYHISLVSPLELKSVSLILWVMNCFLPYNDIPTDEMSQASTHTIAISMTNVLTTYIH